MKRWLVGAEESLVVQVYVTLDGDVYDPEALSAEHRAHLEKAYVSYRRGAPWRSFGELVFREANPLVAAADGRVNHAVYEHPLFRMLMDLDDRLGIAQGKVAEGRRADLADPMRGDEPVSVIEAARDKSVSRMTIHRAIERGELLQLTGEPVRISRLTLDRWKPNRTKQRAGAAGAQARTG
jgi:hypothetical protein